MPLDPSPLPRPAQGVLHTPGQYTCVMAMQFQKWPTKIGFDWPFYPSNNYSLYCTLLNYMEFLN